MTNAIPREALPLPCQKAGCRVDLLQDIRGGATLRHRMPDREPQTVPITEKMLGDVDYDLWGEFKPKLAAYHEEQAMVDLTGADDIEKLFTYQAPTPEMKPKFEAVSKALEQAARVIVEHVPASADRTLAIQHLIDARMRANMGIVFNGERLIPMT